MQNASHIRHLKNIVGKNSPMWSIIVFSDRCVFKDVTTYSNVSIINHDNVLSTINDFYSQNPDVYTEEKTSAIYSKLLPYIQV